MEHGGNAMKPRAGAMALADKSIVFFDGDGTIWYPKKTKWNIAPYWIYRGNATAETYLRHLILTPRVLAALKKLKRAGKLLALISTHPHTRREADLLLGGKVRHLKLGGIFDEVHSSRNYPKGKGEKILQVLRRRKIPKSKALMVGDSYTWDYLSAKKAGVDALLVRSAYMKNGGRRVMTIGGVSELPGFLNKK